MTPADDRGRPPAPPDTITLDDGQRTLRSWLSGKAQALAEIYLGAHRLLIDREPPGWSRFFGHAIRELVNRTVDAELGEEKSSPLGYPTLVQPVVERWIDERPVEWERDVRPPARPATVQISQELADTISLLSDEHLKKTDSLRERLREFFGRIYQDEEIAIPRLVALADRWLALSRWATRQAHDPKRSDSDADALQFQQKLLDYEIPLITALTDMFAPMSDLDVILEDANKRRD